MEIAKFILAGFAGLIGLLLIVPLFTRKYLGIEREIMVDQPLPKVFNYVRLLKNQDSLSVWANKDPQMKKNYLGIDGTVGFISAWDSQRKDVGKGEQEIMKIVDGERIVS